MMLRSQSWFLRVLILAAWLSFPISVFAAKQSGVVKSGETPIAFSIVTLPSHVTSVTLFVTILFRGMTSIWKTVIASFCVGWSSCQPCTQGGKPGSTGTLDAQAQVMAWHAMRACLCLG